MLPTASYAAQSARWPARGKHILAHHDDETIVVYQAYRPEIGEWAIANGRLGGPAFSVERMSWIKPNFLWMMFRSGWGTKEDQEVTLGLRLRRGFFDALLADAVASTYRASGCESQAAWKRAMKRSDVRLQWDPDHGPGGEKLERRAVQLGLRGEALRRMVEDETREVLDMRPLVDAERARLRREGRDAVQTPVETTYQPRDPDAAANVRLDPPPSP